MSEDIRVWGIHTYDDNLFLRENVIAIVWHDMGDLSAIYNYREAFKKKYIETYPDAKKGSIATCAGMLYRFTYEVKEGDYVVFPSKSNREVNIGQVTGEYYYDPNEQNYVQKRSVKWLKHLKRTVFSQGALYEIGSALSFFTVKTYAEEFLSSSFVRTAIKSFYILICKRFKHKLRVFCAFYGKRSCSVVFMIVKRLSVPDKIYLSHKSDRSLC